MRKRGGGFFSYFCVERLAIALVSGSEVGAIVGTGVPGVLGLVSLLSLAVLATLFALSDRIPIFQALTIVVGSAILVDMWLLLTVVDTGSRFSPITEPAISRPLTLVLWLAISLFELIALILLWRLVRWLAAQVGKPRPTEFGGLWPYLWTLGQALPPFAFGFFAIIVWFAGLFALIARLLQNGGLTGIPRNASMWDFVVYSLMNITAQGYSPIKPLSAFTQLLAGAEWVLIVGYNLVVFAALLQYMNPALRAVSKIVGDDKPDDSARQVREDLKEMSRRLDSLSRTIESHEAPGLWPALVSAGRRIVGHR
jgi:hypothetical protein